MSQTAYITLAKDKTSRTYILRTRQNGLNLKYRAILCDGNCHWIADGPNLFTSEEDALREAAKMAVDRFYQL